MMTYQNIIETASAIAESDLIFKKNLIIEYVLPREEHKKLDEDLFYRTKQHEFGHKFEHQEVIEINVGGVNFKITIKE